jgi:hypothetical protein
MKSVWAFIVAAKRSSAKMIVIFFIIRKIYSYKNWLISYFINRFQMHSDMLANLTYFIQTSANLLVSLSWLTLSVWIFLSSNLC